MHQYISCTYKHMYRDTHMQTLTHTSGCLFRVHIVMLIVKKNHLLPLKDLKTSSICLLLQEQQLSNTSYCAGALL